MAEDKTTWTGTQTEGSKSDVGAGEGLNEFGEWVGTDPHSERDAEGAIEADAAARKAAVDAQNAISPQTASSSALDAVVTAEEATPAEAQGEDTGNLPEQRVEEEHKLQASEPKGSGDADHSDETPAEHATEVLAGSTNIMNHNDDGEEKVVNLGRDGADAAQEAVAEAEAPKKSHRKAADKGDK